jgi:hypothetical protein
MAEAKFRGSWVPCIADPSRTGYAVPCSTEKARSCNNHESSEKCEKQHRSGATRDHNPQRNPGHGESSPDVTPVVNVDDELPRNSLETLGNAVLRDLDNGIAELQADAHTLPINQDTAAIATRAASNAALNAAVAAKDGEIVILRMSMSEGGIHQTCLNDLGASGFVNTLFAGETVSVEKVRELIVGMTRKHNQLVCILLKIPPWPQQLWCSHSLPPPLRLSSEFVFVF